MTQVDDSCHAQYSSYNNTYLPLCFYHDHNLQWGIVLSKQKTVRCLISLNMFLLLGANLSTCLWLPEFVLVDVN